jgi:hypothetical protein
MPTWRPGGRGRRPIQETTPLIDARRFPSTCELLWPAAGVAGLRAGSRTLPGFQNRLGMIELEAMGRFEGCQPVLDFVAMGESFEQAAARALVDIGKLVGRKPSAECAGIVAADRAVCLRLLHGLRPSDNQGGADLEPVRETLALFQAPPRSESVTVASSGEIDTFTCPPNCQSCAGLQ